MRIHIVDIQSPYLSFAKTFNISNRLNCTQSEVKPRKQIHPATTINHPSEPQIAPRHLTTNFQHQRPRAKHTDPNNASRLKPTPSRAAAPTAKTTKMPASDYTSTVSGGLKLKGGAKDGGIKKKKKSSSSGSKKKSAVETPTTKDEGANTEETEPSAAAETSNTALARQVQIDEDDDDEQALESRSRSRSGSAVPTNTGAGAGAGSGKTEAQRRHEEIKRKRVSFWRIAIKLPSQTNVY
jgi:hypothetical protein